MITQEKIDRINELAKKAKETGLSEEEFEERAILRKEYLQAIRECLRAQLDVIEFVDEVEESKEVLEETIIMT